MGSVLREAVSFSYCTVEVYSRLKMRVHVVCWLGNFPHELFENAVLIKVAYSFTVTSPVATQVALDLSYGNIYYGTLTGGSPIVTHRKSCCLKQMTKTTHVNIIYMIKYSFFLTIIILASLSRAQARVQHFFS